MSRKRVLDRMLKMQTCFRTNLHVPGLIFLLAMSFGMIEKAQAQVSESAERGGLLMSAGAAISGYYIGYGQRKMLGPSVFVDFGSKAALSVEAEARWLDLREIAGVQDATYLAGPRFAFKSIGRFRPYAKVLVGDGHFTFPYDYAHGDYLVIAPGAGVEYKVSRKIYWRVADFEYQHWNQFTYGSLPSYGVSTGVRFSIF